MKLVLVAAGAVLLFLLAGFGLALWSRRPVPVGLVDGRLRPCPPRPNCVCSEDADAEHATAPLAFTGDPDAAFASLVALIEAEPRARLVAREGELHVDNDGEPATYATAETMVLRSSVDGWKIAHIHWSSRVK
jgi:hypothetical protein